MKKVGVNIWQCYKYIFYREYGWQKKMFGKNDLPQYSAMFAMSLLFFIYIFILNTLLYIFFEVHLIKPYTPKCIILLLMLIVVIFHYFLFIHKKRYEDFVREFENEDKKLRYIRGWTVVLYSVGTIILYLGLLFLGII